MRELSDGMSGAFDSTPTSIIGHNPRLVRESIRWSSHCRGIVGDQEAQNANPNRDCCTGITAIVQPLTALLLSQFVVRPNGHLHGLAGQYLARNGIPQLFNRLKQVAFLVSPKHGLPN